MRHCIIKYIFSTLFLLTLSLILVFGRTTPVKASQPRNSFSVNIIAVEDTELEQAPENQKDNPCTGDMIVNVHLALALVTVSFVYLTRKFK